MQMQPRLVVLFAALALLAQCGGSPADVPGPDLRSSAQRARDRAASVAHLSADELVELGRSRAAAVSDFSADELLQLIQERREAAVGFSADQLRELSAIEYRTLVVAPEEFGDVDGLLNELGRDRWECYHVSDGPDGRTFYFQRRASNLLPALRGLSRVSRFVF